MNELAATQKKVGTANYHRAQHTTIARPVSVINASSGKRSACTNISDLAESYNAQPCSHVARKDLLPDAKKALQKYELAEADMTTAAEALSKAMHKLLEQRGLAQLSPEHVAELEASVLHWCGLCQDAETSQRQQATHRTALKPSELTIRRPDSQELP